LGYCPGHICPQAHAWLIPSLLNARFRGRRSGHHFKRYRRLLLLLPLSGNSPSNHPYDTLSSPCEVLKPETTDRHFRVGSPQVPFIYDDPSSQSLRQGEILAGILEQRQASPETIADDDYSVSLIEHPWVIALSPDCDLAQDHRFRTENNLTHPSILPHIILCDLNEESEIRGRAPGTEIWRRFVQNQDERYHHLPSAQVAASSRTLPDLYLDFKKPFTFPLDILYDAIGRGSVQRVALVPAPYIHDVVHRFYTFLSRVALPD